jgi:hypothetical protein
MTGRGSGAGVIARKADTGETLRGRRSGDGVPAGRRGEDPPLLYRAAVSHLCGPFCNMTETVYLWREQGR